MQGRTLMDILAEHEAECAENARDEAITRVERHADYEWKLYAMSCVRWLAEARQEFTADDVWQRLSVYEDAVTHDPRAMGAVMRKAAREGTIRKTDRVVNSRRAECHARPIAVWESLLIRKDAECL